MLVPLQIQWRDPANLGSLDSAGSCRCDDGCEYVLKDTSDHPLMPHSEWFCTKLAEAVGIACPPCAVIRDESGVFLFGSRWEGGISSEKWWELLYAGEIDPDIIYPVLSRVLAFDLFVHNDDRHLNNFLTRESRNSYSLLAFDFSSSWAIHRIPPLDLPLQKEALTLRAHRKMKNMFGDFLDIDCVNETIDRISDVSSVTIQNIINQHPREWLSAAEESDILSWWDSDLRANRLDGIREGIGNGSLL